MMLPFAHLQAPIQVQKSRRTKGSSLNSRNDTEGWINFLKNNEVIQGGFPNYAIYETRDQRYVGLCAVEKKFWDSFCKTVDRSDLIEYYPDIFSNHQKGASHRQEEGSLCHPEGLLCHPEGVSPKDRYFPLPDLDFLKKEITHIFKSKTFQEWIKIFKKTDFCLTPVLNKEEAWNQEFLKSKNEYLRRSRDFCFLKTPFLGKLKPNFHVPSLGEHNKKYFRG